MLQSPLRAPPDTSLVPQPPAFNEGFREQLLDLFRWRRDVRRFRSEPVPPALVDWLLDASCLAPSVGNSQPWRFVRVDDPARRSLIKANFESCNRAALEGYEGERARLYAHLRLEGLAEAPLQLAVFVDEGSRQGHGLGRTTMPEMLHYSAALAIHTLWLAARACGLGLGWLSILEPTQVVQALEVPPTWTLIGYLCLGYPLAEDDVPALERQGWQERQPHCRQVLQR